MKRILGFIIGLSLSLGLGYLVRQLLTGNTAPVAPAQPIAPPEPTPTTDRPAARYTVRTSGPRPQSPVAETVIETQPEMTTEQTIVGESEGRHEEPVAATNTDQSATTPRSEMTEPAILDDLPVEVPPDETKPMTSLNEEGETDFTVITDIGPVFNKKLHEAGIKTFGELATLSPQEIEEKTDIPASRVERGEWIKQAARLAEGLSAEG